MNKMYDAGITILSVYEEDIFRVLAFCFSGAETLNESLKFAVRSVKTPVGTIEKMLENDRRLGTVGKRTCFGYTSGDGVFPGGKNLL